MAGETLQDYVVLARKYRSRTFGELIGQDALVRTLTNAIASDRIHHAYVLTGIRGIGKTSTARLLAMALNCQNGPAVTWDENDPEVQAIRQGTHPDVLEFDAASNRGVEEIANLFSGLNYAPVLGRYKVYIIDEVHMLSTHAFNALLKTLEEPPAKVKFIFATTEVQKIPVTVLSRCQRFDLKRIPSEVLQGHYTAILEKEKLAAEPEAVSLIAKAADGSVRDGLSLLDQAIALSHGETVKASLVQDMLGLVDRVRVYDLLETLLAGNVPGALAILDDLYAGGQDAVMLVQGLLEVVHLVTRIKLVPSLKEGVALSELERTRGMALAEKMNLPNLSRVYQLLAQAASDVKEAERPYEALSMAAVRVAYMAPMPAVEQLAQQGQNVVRQAAATPVAASAGAMARGNASSAAAPVQTVVAQAVASVAAPWEEPGAAASVVVTGPETWPDVVALVRQEKQGLAAALSQQVRCLELNAHERKLTVAVEKGLHLGSEITRQLKEILREATGQVWQVGEGQAGDAAPATLREVAAAEGVARREAATEEAVVQDVMAMFPGAVVEDVRTADRN